MSHTETVKNVPNDQVAQVKLEFEAEGATVSVSDNGDGTSDVTATFPDASSDTNVSAAAAHASAASAHAAAASAHASVVAAKASAART